MSTAALTIAAFQSTLLLTPDGWQPGQRRDCHNILRAPEDGDWDTDHVACLRNAADRKLHALGYTRAAGWEYHASNDVHTAPIAAAGADRDDQ
ncbi:hypothetical protein C1I95_17405 [Micromonospora craterilacus]|uniref:Uncharacterized protein n=1 Tax=Micromonospora craterilacus TaxID=1655439 RepID=A0A2W2E1C8_9ACTN|nr:hypothetical protein [Micromonospora craterilacus]PZG16483.1 hypothetical protein C1I95_17405 [Micromonospora craterilacus]